MKVILGIIISLLVLLGLATISVVVFLVMRYQNLDAMGKRIVLIAKTLDKQFSCNLGSLAQKTAKRLEAHVKLGYNYFEGKITEDAYKKHWKSLVKSAMALAEKAEEVAD